MNGTGLTPEQAAKFKAEIAAAWDKPSYVEVSGSIDLKDRGAEIDVEVRDPKEPKQNE